MDVGGGHVTAALVVAPDDAPGPLGAAGPHDTQLRPRPRIVERTPQPLDSQADRDVVLGTFERAARSLVSPGAAWTIAMPGPFDYPRGTGTFAGIGKFQALAGVDLRAELAARLDTAPEQVRFCNDAAAYGIGEWAFGTVRRPVRLVCITLGTGIGSAFVHDGTVVTSGPHVPQDGEAHTIRYEGAPLEDTVSSRAIRARYRAATGVADSGSAHPDRDGGARAACVGARADGVGARADEGPTVAEIAARAAGGEQPAAVVLAEAMTDLGRALRPWVEGFGAEVLVVGGAMSQSWSLLEPGLRAGLARDGVGDGPTPASTAGVGPAPARTAGVGPTPASTAGGSLVLRPSALLDDAPLLGAAVWRQRTGTTVPVG